MGLRRTPDMDGSDNQTQPSRAADVTAVAPSAPGGTLRQFQQYLQATGQTHVMSPDGKTLWVQTMTGGLERFPLDTPVHPSSEELHRVLRARGIWLAVYLCPSDDPHPPNAFHYVCRDQDYSLEKLASNSRRDIRRGLRNFTIRLCTWDEFMAKGLPAYADTAARHEQGTPSVKNLEQIAAKRQGQPFFEIWGAWRGEELAAWMDTVKVDDWCLITMACSCNKELSWCPNNALVYEATRRILIEERYSSISYGISSALFRSGALPLHRFKTKMGYQAEPHFRGFVAHPLLTPLLKWRCSSWIWGKLAVAMPKAVMLNRLAGISRLISGRDKNPLAWAEEPETGEQAS